MKDPNLEEAIQIAKRMEHAAKWLQEMDASPKQTEQGVVAEIRNKEELRGIMEWNKFNANFDGVKANKEKKRKTQEWRVIKCYRCDAPGHIASRSKNVVADYLSRVPVDEGEFVEDGVKDVVGTILGEMAITAQECEHAETIDPILQIVKERVVNGWRNSDERDCDLVRKEKETLVLPQLKVHYSVRTLAIKDVVTKVIMHGSQKGHD
ncbi:hypothetical protein NDU88_006004 [Pleurodeles waltl]|uniref:Uncharacterized protein n=1 Tax=Pleurodeles waltl TaxID=8319 RepID=A0AAV7LQN7_PLEWA|nr:hypothetical protein NDU88_006004 [Pleurodeles waltl]